MIKLVKSIKDRFVRPKILISLTTPRDDGLQNKVTQINTAIQELSRGDNQVKTCHHQNLAERGRANPRFYSSDRYHLNEIGIRILAANLRYSLEGKRIIKDMQKDQVQRSQTTPYGSNLTYMSTSQFYTNTNTNTTMIPPHKMISSQYNYQSQVQNVSPPQAPHRSTSQVCANNTQIPSQYNCQPQAPHVNEPLLQYGSHQQALYANQPNVQCASQPHHDNQTQLYDIPSVLSQFGGMNRFYADTDYRKAWILPSEAYHIRSY